MLLLVTGLPIGASHCLKIRPAPAQQVEPMRDLVCVRVHYTNFVLCIHHAQLSSATTAHHTANIQQYSKALMSRHLALLTGSVKPVSSRRQKVVVNNTVQVLCKGETCGSHSASRLAQRGLDT